MLQSLLQYNFFILSILFLLPGGLIYWLRKDLRKVMQVLALCSLPFAFTEFLFYPTYWEPKFLFDLIDVLGFGIEDLLFVIGLSGFTSTSYAFVFHKTLIQKTNRGKLSPSQRVCLFFVIVCIAILILVRLQVHLIYGAPLLMSILSAFIFVRRKDLILPGFLGAILSTIMYALLCYTLISIYPNIFQLTWHTEKFVNQTWLGLPAEELVYAFTSGAIASIFYPYVFSFKYSSF